MAEDTGFGSIHEISVLVDGETYTGRVREGRDGITVEFEGAEASRPIGHDRPEDVADELLRQMVRDKTS